MFRELRTRSRAVFSEISSKPNQGKPRNTKKKAKILDSLGIKFGFPSIPCLVRAFSMGYRQFQEKNSDPAGPAIGASCILRTVRSLRGLFVACPFMPISLSLCRHAGRLKYHCHGVRNMSRTKQGYLPSRRQLAARTVANNWNHARMISKYLCTSRENRHAPGNPSDQEPLLRLRPFEIEREQAGEGVFGGNVLGPAVGGGHGAGRARRGRRRASAGAGCRDWSGCVA